MANSYEERQQRRKERLEARAAKARRNADRHLDTAREIASHIPPGQPILVGHHSEGRHRRDISRIDNQHRQAHNESARAENLERQAEAVGTGGISSDDPEALVKLRAELAAAEAEHAQMIAANKLVKKEDRAGLAALGFTETAINKLLAGDFVGRKGFPPYAITNSGANIRRLKQRVEELEKLPERQAAFQEMSGEGWRLYHEDNRLCIWFAEKPSEEDRRGLKRHGFKWSPTRTAWVRQFNNNAIWAARQILQI